VNSKAGAAMAEAGISAKAPWNLPLPTYPLMIPESLDLQFSFKAVNVLATSVGLVSCWAAWRIVQSLLENHRSPLCALPGPPSDSLLFGNFFAILGKETQEIFYKWQNTYGHVFSMSMLLGVSSFPTHDEYAPSVLFTLGIHSLAEVSSQTTKGSPIS
jgi:hypothetical protein